METTKRRVGSWTECATESTVEYDLSNSDAWPDEVNRDGRFPKDYYYDPTR